MSVNPSEVVEVSPGLHQDRFGRQIVKCSFCAEQWTYMTGTKLCDRCWELKRRVQADPHLARRALAELDAHE